ncbi:MAG TPA: hypothetical protein DDZ67_09690 [Xanthomonadaceae bacterium]|nr:hypothetical protein [Xanthomonadaceae bacterium]
MGHRERAAHGRGTQELREAPRLRGSEQGSGAIENVLPARPGRRIGCPHRARRWQRGFHGPHPCTELPWTHTKQLFDRITEDTSKVTKGGEHPLLEAGRAHAGMESRATAGKLLLIPGLARPSLASLCRWQASAW